jgi:hypothetical protein
VSGGLPRSLPIAAVAEEAATVAEGEAIAAVAEEATTVAEGEAIAAVADDPAAVLVGAPAPLDEHATMANVSTAPVSNAVIFFIVPVDLSVSLRSDETLSDSSTAPLFVRWSFVHVFTDVSSPISE